MQLRLRGRRFPMFWRLLAVIIATSRGRCMQQVRFLAHCRWGDDLFSCYTWYLLKSGFLYLVSSWYTVLASFWNQPSICLCRCLQAAVGVALQAFMVGVVFAKVQVCYDNLFRCNCIDSLRIACSSCPKNEHKHCSSVNKPLYAAAMGSYVCSSVSVICVEVSLYSLV